MRLICAYYFALAIKKKLCEVPLHMLRVGTGFQPFVEVACFWVIYIDLFHDRESYSVFLLGESYDLSSAFGLLTAELVARESEDLEALITVGFVDFN